MRQLEIVEFFLHEKYTPFILKPEKAGYILEQLSRKV